MAENKPCSPDEAPAPVSATKPSSSSDSPTSASPAAVNPAVPSETSGESNTSDMPTVKPAAAAHTEEGSIADTESQADIYLTF